MAKIECLLSLESSILNTWRNESSTRALTADSIDRVVVCSLGQVVRNGLRRITSAACRTLSMFEAVSY